MEEIFVSSKDGSIYSFCDSTYEKVDMGALNSFFSALVA